MSYALGVELAVDAVRIASTTSGTVLDEQVALVPPVLFVDGATVSIGAAAVYAGADRPQSLVQDVVGQYPTDRLFLSGGRMLTTDDALKELLVGAVAEVTARRGEAPTAVTVTHPSIWDTSTRERLAGVVAGAGLASPNILVGVDAASASAEAWTRLPKAREVEARPTSDMPATRSGLRPEQVAAAAQPELERHETKVRSTRRAAVLSAVTLVVLVGAFGLIIVLTRGDDETSASSSTTTTPPSTTGVPTPTVPTSTPTRSVVVGFLGAGPAEGELRAVLDEVNAAGGIFDHPVQVVVQVPGVDPATAVDQMTRQGVTVIVSALDPASLASAAERAGAADLAICSVAGAPASSQLPDGGVVGSGTARECAESLALASQAAGDVDAAGASSAWREVLGEDGVSCTTYTQCSNLISGNQLVVYEPAGRTISLVST